MNRLITLTICLAGLIIAMCAGEYIRNSHLADDLRRDIQRINQADSLTTARYQHTIDSLQSIATSWQHQHRTDSTMAATLHLKNQAIARSYTQLRTLTDRSTSAEGQPETRNQKPEMAGRKILLKNDPNPFDTAVAIRIDLYHLESIRMATADSLITSLQNELGAQSSATESVRQALLARIAQVKALEQQVATKNETITALNQANDQLLADRRKWYNRRWPWITLGLIGGALITNPP